MADRANAAEQLLYLLKANPSLLPLAPSENQGQAIEHRRQDEVHMCLRCGQRAQCAFIATIEQFAPGFEYRWLDLCASCTHWLRTTLPPEGMWPRATRP